MFEYSVVAVGVVLLRSEFGREEVRNKNFILTELLENIRYTC